MLLTPLPWLVLAALALAGNSHQVLLLVSVRCAQIPPTTASRPSSPWRLMMSVKPRSQRVKRDGTCMLVRATASPASLAVRWCSHRRVRAGAGHAAWGAALWLFRQDDACGAAGDNIQLCAALSYDLVIFVHTSASAVAPPAVYCFGVQSDKKHVDHQDSVS
jgi:hypothetical protein